MITLNLKPKELEFEGKSIRMWTYEGSTHISLDGNEIKNCTSVHIYANPPNNISVQLELSE